MKGVPLSAILDGASRLLDLGGTRALRGREAEDQAVLRDLRDAWADVAGELRAVVAEESAAHGSPVEVSPGNTHMITEIERFTDGRAIRVTHRYLRDDEDDVGEESAAQRVKKGGLRLSPPAGGKLRTVDLTEWANAMPEAGFRETIPLADQKRHLLGIVNADSRDFYAWEGLGDVNVLLGDVGAAHYAYVKAANLAPDNQGVQAKLSLAQQILARPLQGREKDVEVPPENPRRNRLISQDDVGKHVDADTPPSFVRKDLE